MRKSFTQKRATNAYRSPCLRGMSRCTSLRTSQLRFCSRVQPWRWRCRACCSLPAAAAGAIPAHTPNRPSSSPVRGAPTRRWTRSLTFKPTRGDEGILFGLEVERVYAIADTCDSVLVTDGAHKLIRIYSERQHVVDVRIVVMRPIRSSRKCDGVLRAGRRSACPGGWDSWAVAPSCELRRQATA